MNEVIEAAPRTVAVQAAGAVATPGQLLQLAVERGADLAYVQKLMELQERFEANTARNAHNAAFAAFKADAVTIVKGKLITDGPLKGKKHADLFDVVSAVSPALAKHGMSISWKLTKDEKDWIEVTCYLKHAAGHVETVSMGGAPDTGPGRNAIQARCSVKTYLERYTATAILGMAATDADDDGAGGAPAVMVKGVLAGLLADVAKAADDAATVALWNSGKKTLASLGDTTASDEFKAAVVARRTALKGGA